MWIYEKKLEYPVNIKKCDLLMANYLMSQYRGPDSEFSASLQYLNQRYTMPDDKGKALLTDIATEEFGHVEMIATMVCQLTKDAKPDEMKKYGLGEMFTMHDNSPFPASPSGEPFTTAYIATTGDYIAVLESNIASEQRARATYEHLMDLTNDIDLIAPLLYLRQRVRMHYQRFKESRNYYLEKNI